MPRALRGIRLFDIDSPDQGIVHVISPELGLTLPGITVVCPDSHTCTQGAVGALAWGIGSTEAEHALITGTLRIRKPRTLRVRFEGALARGVTAKDLSMRLLADYGAAGGQWICGGVCGRCGACMDIEARLTLCNMTTEFSAMTGLIAPDDTTFAYLYDRRFAPKGQAWDLALQHWRLLHSDESAEFDREILIDAGSVAPMVTWGTSPQQAVAVDTIVPQFAQSRSPRDSYARALEYMSVAPGARMDSLKIDAAFIGSCTNGRLSDLRRAARILDGRHVASGVRALVVPGSSSVKRQAEAEGLDRIFKAAGFEWRESGCSLCFNAGGESFGRKERVISSTNRNFESRQGPETRTHLASPETVAASAVNGRISDARAMYR